MKVKEFKVFMKRSDDDGEYLHVLSFLHEYSFIESQFAQSDMLSVQLWGRLNKVDIIEEKFCDNFDVQFAFNLELDEVSDIYEDDVYSLADIAIEFEDFVIYKRKCVKSTIFTEEDSYIGKNGIIFDAPANEVAELMKVFDEIVCPDIYTERVTDIDSDMN